MGGLHSRIKVAHSSKESCALGGPWEIAERSTTWAQRVGAVETGWTEARGGELEPSAETENTTLPWVRVAGSNPVFRSQGPGQTMCWSGSCTALWLRYVHDTGSGTWDTRPSASTFHQLPSL
jgi:hypothetical protein